MVYDTQVHMQSWVNTPAHDAVMRLVFSFVLTTLKASILARPGLFPRLEGLAVFWDVMEQFSASSGKQRQASASVSNSKQWQACVSEVLQRRQDAATDLHLQAEAIMAQRYIKDIGQQEALLGLLLCDRVGCTNMEETSELKLVTTVCAGCRTERYCSRDCQASAWRRGHRLKCTGRRVYV